MLDLGALFGDDGSTPKAPELLVDKSNRPIPTRAVVTLSTGVQIEADVQYRGTHGYDRRYRISAELSWDTVTIVRIDVDRSAPDIVFTIYMPWTVSDERALEIGHNIEWHVGQMPWAPNIIRRT